MDAWICNAGASGSFKVGERGRGSEGIASLVAGAAPSPPPHAPRDAPNNDANPHPHQQPFLDASPETLEAVVRTNLLGTLLCARAAARLMLGQALGGHVYLMDGAGADGAATPQYAAYGERAAVIHIGGGLGGWVGVRDAASAGASPASPRTTTRTTNHKNRRHQGRVSSARRHAGAGAGWHTRGRARAVARHE